MSSNYAEEIWEPGDTGRWTRKHGKRREMTGITLDDFHAYMPMHAYIYAPTRELWPGASVNALIEPIPLLDKHGKPILNENGKPKTISATQWLDRNRTLAQMTWCPALPMLIRDRLVSHGGWINRKGVTCFNLYREPLLELGDPTKAERWLEHVHIVFPNDAMHIIRWLAHRVQYPQQKINHALVLGGVQGIGKDTLLEPVKHAVGPWNFHDVSPIHLLGTFNGFAKSVILRVNEARDLGNTNRFDFYDHTKIYTAAPPDVLRVNEKYLREYDVFNCLGFLITTNHKVDGLYLPPDDRRHYVAWSNLEKKDFADEYWNKIWGWYERYGGSGHVAAHLTELDLSGFDPKAPPPKTRAFWDIVDASRAPEDAELADVIDALGQPDAVILPQLLEKATGETQEWLFDRKNRRAVPHRLERCGYVPVRNPDAPDDGYWRIRNKRHPVYAKANLHLREQIIAARRLQKEKGNGG
jgi:hypothetical protein